MRRRCSRPALACACALGILAGESAQAAGLHDPDERHCRQPVGVVAERPCMAVLVYNYAAVSASIMSVARRRVNRLYRDAGVEIEWLDPLADARYRIGPTSDPSHAFTIQMLIRSRRSSQVPATPGSVMGEAALPADEHGGVLSIFYDQVARVAHQYHQPLADVLGLAIAHEMGHLLLPDHAHSTSGIMRADWGGDDIRHGVDGSLSFTSAEAALIRAKISANRGSD